MSLNHDSKSDHQERSGPAGAEHPTDPSTSRELAGLLTKIAPNTQSLSVTAPSDEVSLITLKIEVTSGMSLRALVDCVASTGFIRRQSLEDSRLNYVEREFPPTRMKVCLASDALKTVNKRLVGIHYTLEEKQYDDDFIVPDLDDKFDFILGLPRKRKYQPWISWQHRSVRMLAVCSSDGHLKHILGRLQACGCTTSEFDGLTCGTVVSMTAQDHSVKGHCTVEQASGTCVETQAAPKVEQHVEARSTIRESIVEQTRSTERESIEEDVTVEEHPQSEHVLEKSSSVPESDKSRESYVEGADPQPSADVLFQKITEKVNVLVSDASKVGAYTLDLVTLPKSASDVVKLPTLESKRFLRDLRSDKIKQICVLVTEDENVTDIRSAQVFVENERVISSSSMDESVLDEKTRIERYTSQSWEF
uniref:Uncharacterized protein n=1 Tax=Peronospora matthiolae TaxID=2874970 RepID=A0AAV1U8M7_9STRA